MTLASGAEYASDPVQQIVSNVCLIEQHLTSEQVRTVILSITTEGSKRRCLADALEADPQVLRTGRPPAPKVVAELLLALRAAGASNVAAPRCSRCDREQRKISYWTAGAWG